MAKPKESRKPSEIEVATLSKSLLDSLTGGGVPVVVRKGKASFVAIGEDDQDLKGPATLQKAVLDVLNQQEVHRLAFEQDPTNSTQYRSVYQAKTRLLPDKLLKRIAIQDPLVACIIQARQNQISAFGRPRPDPHSTGFVIEQKQETTEEIEHIEDEERKKQMRDALQKKIAAATKKLMTCGEPDALGEEERLTLPQYLSESCRNALVVGRIATEIIFRDSPGGHKEFSCFRVIDAGTIYRAAPQKTAVETIRQQARHLLELLNNEKIKPERFENDEYNWVQVIEERPVQAFTSKECVVKNFFHVPDVELDSYPVTPLDTVISDVTTHINITTHNKLYFQHGRASRGMLVVNSDDVGPNVVARFRQQFNASINSVQNSWRMPVFSVGKDDKLTWQAIDSGGRDMEFQYLSDTNARTILSAFAMSPDELPGWSYLSRGTNNQAMSESNNEYRLEAHRDLGIRPLLAAFEDHLNQNILPLIDKDLAKTCVIKLVGLDAETPEKRDVRIGQAQQVHMTMDEVLAKVEKRPIGKRWGGEYPLNPLIQAIHDKYFTVGEIREHFLGVEGAAKDPRWDYVRDQFFAAQQQRMDAMAQAQAQAQAQQQAGGGGQPPAGPGGPAPGDGGEQPQDQGGEAAGPPERQEHQTETQKSAAVSDASGAAQELSGAVDQAQASLGKSEAIQMGSKRLQEHQDRVIEHVLDGWAEDSKAALADIFRIAGIEGN